MEPSEPTETDVRRRIVVSGRVQGVWFRDTCRQVASGLALRGWVRNDADGTVEIVAEGPAERIDELVAWCHHGPPHAEVTEVSVSAESVVGESSFRVVG